jgi:NAD-dependent SIR2 family protein deacetylase
LRQFFSPVRERADVTPKKHAAKYSSEAVRIPRCEKCNGVVKPDIVFFGEDLPDRFHELVKGDTAAADLLLVIGTSLKVAVSGVRPGADTTLMKMVACRSLSCSRCLAFPIWCIRRSVCEFSSTER